MTNSAIDWSQLWYPGPRRVFTAAEMARAGGPGPSRTLVTMVLLNYASMVFALLYGMPSSEMGRLVGAQVAVAVGGLAAARWLWRRPSRGPLMMVMLAATAAMLGFVMLVRAHIGAQHRAAVGIALSVPLLLMLLGLWFLTIWRSQQIAGRLAELDERERAVEMARRLAAAQIEPHFLFNTLASLQHWVATGDARAAPMLDALVSYLRATLPMFSRPLHALADELAAVQGYLGVMAARFGPRLAWSVDVPEALRAQPLPPGLLLTLVENAVEHGVEPRIGGGRVVLRAQRGPGWVEIEVADDGDGPPPGMVDGTGLANCRERLALAGGTLDIARGDAGGCVARVRLKEPTA